MQDVPLFELVTSLVSQQRSDPDRTEITTDEEQLLRECATREGAAGVAERLVLSIDAARRVVGVRLAGFVGQDATTSATARAQIFSALLPLAYDMEDQAMQLTAIQALARLDDQQVLTALDDLFRSASWKVRLEVVRAFTDVLATVPVPKWTSAHASGLLRLLEAMGDTSDDVRDWATFGVGTQLDVDGHVIREALAKVLFDDHHDARGEAVVGLARRRDPRAFAAVQAALESGHVSKEIIEAATYVASPELTRLLRPYLDDWKEAGRAIALGDPAERQEVDQRVWQFVVSMAEHPDAEHFAVVCPLFGTSIHVDEIGSELSVDFEALLEAEGGNIDKAVTKVFELPWVAP
jgi:hypothetical protein